MSAELNEATHEDVAEPAEGSVHTLRRPRALCHVGRLDEAQVAPREWHTVVENSVHFAQLVVAVCVVLLLLLLLEFIVQRVIEGIELGQTLVVWQRVDVCRMLLLICVCGLTVAAHRPKAGQHIGEHERSGARQQANVRVSVALMWQRALLVGADQMRLEFVEEVRDEQCVELVSAQRPQAQARHEETFGLHEHALARIRGAHVQQLYALFCPHLKRSN